MMPITRRDFEILLDSPHSRDFVVSAYADLRVRDGFHRYADAELKNQQRALAGALGDAALRKALEADLEAVRRAVGEADPTARGLAVFSGAHRKLFHVVRLDFPVENHLVIDEDPYVMPLLERWYGQPNYLAVAVATRQVHFFEARSGVAEAAGALKRESDPTPSRDGGQGHSERGRFTYKKEFSQSWHERLKDLSDDGFFKEVAGAIATHWKDGNFQGLILVGQVHVTAALRRVLPRDLDAAVVEEAHLATETGSSPDAISALASRVLECWRAEQREKLMGELGERWKRQHLVANGAVEVLDALQQGRATDVVIGPRRDLGGATCTSCGYRFGTPVGTCAYCQAPTRNVNAVQEILRMALRHRVPVHLLDRNGRPDPDPLAPAGGVAALLRAEANWAPDAETARASMGHG